MRNLETGKHIKLSNGDEYYICRNMLSNNAEYFLLLTVKTTSSVTLMPAIEVKLILATGFSP